jgi:hypothetical protein
LLIFSFSHANNVMTDTEGHSKIRISLNMNPINLKNSGKMGILILILDGITVCAFYLTG